MRSIKRITSQKLDTSDLMPNDEALVRCRAALELRDKGDYVRAREVMLPLWKGVGHHPDVVLDRSKGVAEPGELGADSIRVQCQRTEDPHSANAIHRFFLFGAPCPG